MQMVIVTYDLGFEVSSKKSVTFISIAAHLTMQQVLLSKCDAALTRNKQGQVSTTHESSDLPPTKIQLRVSYSRYRGIRL